MTNDEQLNDSEMSAVREQIQQVMPAVTERIHYAEGRRSNFSAIAGAMLAGGIALVTVAIGHMDSMATRFGFAAAGLSSFVLGSLLLVVYGIQTNRYPWTSATKTWKWFYRDALPEEKAFDLPWTSYIRFGAHRHRVQSEYARQLCLFRQTVARLADEGLSLEQDVEQLYVLHVNEKYKNMQLVHLRKITVGGFVASAAVVVLAVAVGYWCDNRLIEPQPFSYERDGLTLRGNWYRAACDDVENCNRVLLKVDFQNNTKTPAPLPRLVASDSAGVTIPLVVKAIEPEITEASPGSTTSLVLVLEPIGIVRAPLLLVLAK